MKSTDLNAETRQHWLRNEQVPRVTASEPARQSNFEKSSIFRWTLVAASIVIVANVLQSAPIDEPSTAYRVTV